MIREVVVERYFAPAGSGEAEIVEKRSKFLARLVPAGNEDEAKDEIARVRAKHHDARHHCWCYIIRNGTERYSDDGEPQGTAGMPMLEVLRHNGVFDVCCVVTRYFGGTLLGPGGLARAYSGAAKKALDNAGITEMQCWECVKFTCGYSIVGKVKSELASFGGVIENIEYGENATFSVLLPTGSADSFNERLAEVTAGSVTGTVTGSVWRVG